jgi:hypothetical protein
MAAGCSPVEAGGEREKRTLEQAIDLLAAALVRDPEEYTRLRAAIMTRRDTGKSRLEETRERLGHLQGRCLLDTWYEMLGDLCSNLETRDPGGRLR